MAPADFTLSVVIPVYNEERTLARLVDDGRAYQEGKHVGWRDGFRAIWHILEYR